MEGQDVLLAFLENMQIPEHCPWLVLNLEDKLGSSSILPGIGRFGKYWPDGYSLFWFDHGLPGMIISQGKLLDGKEGLELGSDCFNKKYFLKEYNFKILK